MVIALATVAYKKTHFCTSPLLYLMQTCLELYLPDEDPDWIETLQRMRSLSQYWRTV